MHDSNKVEKLKSRIRELETRLQQLEGGTAGEIHTNEKISIALSAGKFAWWDMFLPSGKVSFNDQKVTMLGYDPSDFPDPHFQDFVALLHPDDQAPAMEAMYQHLSGEKEYYDVEYRITAKDGSYHWFYDRGAITERDGDKISLTGIVVDITDRSEAQMKLMEANRSLEAANAEKDMLLSIIAHDLNNPFMPILGYSSRLKSLFHTLGDETKLKYVDRIYNGALNVQKLLQNLLTWSRSQRGRIVVEQEEVNLAELIQSETRQIMLAAEEKQVQLFTSVENNCRLNSDPDILSVIIRNLLTNAVKFTASGGTVTVSAELKDKQCIVAVNDTGIGMPQEILENLYRFDRDILRNGTANEKGSGLGLKLCKDFADRLGGSLSFTSTEGEGTTATLILPAK